MNGYVDTRTEREKALQYAMQLRGYDPLLNPNGEQDVDQLLVMADKILVFLEGDEVTN